MRSYRIVLAGAVMVLCIASLAAAGDFEWLRNLNIQAQADPSGFRAQLSTRFRIGPAEVNAVIGKVPEPADAYMVMRLGEMSGQPVDRVVETYNADRSKGWGNLAKSLGIKPGSREFHALKRGHDLGGGDLDSGKGKGKKDKKKKNR
ncbi:MAG: hypothetical protein ACYC7L_13960 [Nitrospirota bacterium]